MASKPSIPWTVQRDCSHNGTPILALTIAGASKAVGHVSGEVWMTFPCLCKGDIAALAVKFRALADEIEKHKGQEGGMWSMPWEETVK